MKRRYWLGLGLLFITLFNAIPSQAAIVLKRFRQPVPIEIETAVNTASSTVNSAFEIKLTEQIQYQGQSIPQNTKLMGTITEIQHGKRWRRSAAFKVRFDTVAFPNQPNLSIRPAVVTFYTPQHQSAPSTVIHNLFLQNASLLISGPVTWVAHLSAGHFLLLDTGLEIVIGAGYGVLHHDPDDQRPAYQRIGSSILIALSPIPISPRIAAKSRELYYSPGTQLTIPLGSTLLKDLLFGPHPIVPTPS